VDEKEKEQELAKPGRHLCGQFHSVFIRAGHDLLFSFGTKRDGRVCGTIAVVRRGISGTADCWNCRLMDARSFLLRQADLPQQFLESRVVTQRVVDWIDLDGSKSVRAHRQCLLQQLKGLILFIHT
jgi:hypothetical protein